VGVDVCLILTELTIFLQFSRVEPPKVDNTLKAYPIVAADKPKSSGLFPQNNRKTMLWA